jgi:hypothetical protein
LAGWRGRPHNRFTGLYDDVRIYGGVLDDAMIVALADPASDFYTKEALPPVADPGVGYSAWLRDERAVIKLDAGSHFAGRNGGPIRYRWELVSAPEGAHWRSEDSASPLSRLVVDKAGDYRLRLTISNAVGSDSATVSAAVFAMDPKAGRPANPFSREPWSVLGIADLEPSRPERVAVCKGPIAPIAYWGFNENANVTANATEPEARPVSLDPATMTLVPGGKTGGALKLQPQKNHHPAVDFGSFAELSSEFSLAFWLKSDRTDKRATLFSALGDKGKNYWSLSNQHNLELEQSAQPGRLAGGLQRDAFRRGQLAHPPRTALEPRGSDL